MKYSWIAVLLVFATLLVPSKGQDTSKNAALEKTLSDVNEQWLCASQYYKPKAQDCVDFRAKYWAEQFFEVGQTGKVQTKAEMVPPSQFGLLRRTARPNTAPGNPRNLALSVCSI